MHFSGRIVTSLQELMYSNLRYRPRGDVLYLGSLIEALRNPRQAGPPAFVDRLKQAK